MSKVILKNERTGETFVSDNFQKEPSESEIMQMSYSERLELYNNDRSRYDHLMSKIASSKPCKQPTKFKPWDYSKCNYILRKED